MRRLIILFCLLTTPAFAHIVADPKTGEAGAYFRTNLRVTHGCDGMETTSITMTVPKNIISIKPQAKPGWIIEIGKHKLDQPIQGPHGPIAELTDTITWRGHLPDSEFDEFGLSMKLPETTKPLFLPVLQRCGDKSRNWNETLSDHHHNHDGSPAPVITVTPKKNQK